MSIEFRVVHGRVSGQLYSKTHAHSTNRAILNNSPAPTGKCAHPRPRTTRGDRLAQRVWGFGAIRSAYTHAYTPGRHTHAC